MYPENTISAFKAGNRMGLDFLEMDVQVSKYKVPVVFHDGTVKLCLQVSPTSLASTSIEIPVKDLTVDQMQTVKVSGIQESVAYKNAKNKIHENSSGGSGSTSSPSSVEKSLHDIEVDYKLFPTLKEDGESIDDQCMDQNEFVDCILQVVFDNARDRKVILASFDANICSIPTLQNLYPIPDLRFKIYTLYQTYAGLQNLYPMPDLRFKIYTLYQTYASKSIPYTRPMLQNVYRIPDLRFKIYTLYQTYASKSIPYTRPTLQNLYPIQTYASKSIPYTRPTLQNLYPIPDLCFQMYTVYQTYASKSIPYTRPTLQNLYPIPDLRFKIYTLYQTYASKSIPYTRPTLQNLYHIPDLRFKIYTLYQTYASKSIPYPRPKPKNQYPITD
ncbi:hypothetical protein QZH41_014411 [Actinostola sp. cb2023]|nr:hypothetical protein QZH41_014411 [Actinostola sp. cb2023]